MVKKVFGKVNGQEVKFDQVEGNAYQVEFPSALDSGNYIVDIFAEDDAGNISYLNTLLCTIDPNGMCVHAKKIGHYLKLKKEADPEITNRVRPVDLIKNDTGIDLMAQDKWIYLMHKPPERCRRHK